MNKIEIANVNIEAITTPLSRYVNSNVVYYTMGTRKVLTFNTYKKQNNLKDDKNDMYMINNHEYRPDLVSYDVYGTPDFWWKILEANNIKDIFDFKKGINIRIPSSVF